MDLAGYTFYTYCINIW